MFRQDKCEPGRSLRITGVEELMMRSLSVAGLGLLLAVSSFAQQGELKARELFYTPLPDIKAKAAESKPAEAKPVAKSESKSPVRRERPASGGAKSEPAVEAHRNEAANAGSGRVQHVSTGEPVGPPLALKYRLLKRTDDGAYSEVDTDTIFRSGDKIRVSVESNDRAHLYIVQQGTSNTWNLLFPNEDTEQGSNRVERNHEYEIPGGGRFTFDEQPGTERMFIILSRQPEADLEKLIYALSQGNSTAKPASGDKTADKPKMMIAQSRIDDSLIGRLRERDKVLARDLVFEKVNDDKPAKTPAGTRKEKALYVATPDRTAAARIIVDLNLKHQ
jgi:hypothetical protein